MLEKLWESAKVLQLKPEESRNEVWLSKGVFHKTTWHMAARRDHVELLEKLWESAKELQLKPEELRNQLWLSQGQFDQTACFMAAE